MIKMVTLLVVLDHLERGDLRWEQPIVISPEVERVEGSSIYARAGEVFTVRQLVAATTIKSANDAAVALAIAAAGSQEAFVEEMRAKAAELGLREAEIHTPNGLPTRDTGKPLDRMSAADLARIGAEVLRHPELMELAGTALADPLPGREFHLYNSNHLLRRYEHATGIKTGYTTEADFCVTASARRHGMDLVAVVIGAERKFDSFDGARALLEEAFDRYRLVAPLRQGQLLARPALVRRGSSGTVPVMAAYDVRGVAPRGRGYRFSYQLLSRGAAAPVRPGQVVGTILVRRDGELVASVPAVAAVPVQPPSRWEDLKQRVWGLLAHLL
jgi:D-alanyl-D-alanine carboxypeptidase (penicillin-binding protein 5/6)